MTDHDPRVDAIASIITDLWPHRQSRKAAEEIVKYVDRLGGGWDVAPHAHSAAVPRHRGEPIMNPAIERTHGALYRGRHRQGVA